MRSKYPDVRGTFIFDLEAFLSSAKSALDVMMEDVNRRFSLGIGMNRKISWPLLRNKAGNDQKILDCIKLCEDGIKSIRATKIGRLVLQRKGLRNWSVHRIVVKPTHAEVIIVDGVACSDSLTVEVTNVSDGQSRVISTPAPELEIRGSVPRESPAVNWFFEKYPDKNVIDACTELADLISSLVTDVKNRFFV